MPGEQGAVSQTDNSAVAILMRQHAYAGREYAQALTDAGLPFDVVTYGSFPLQNDIEEDRCDGLWNPPIIDTVCSPAQVYHFSSVSSESLRHQLEQYEVGIQGGNGILGPDVFERFRTGMLNFHPGKLPEYRGCSAPEYQVYDGEPVYGTCHVLQEGIDDGPIIRTERMDVDMESYPRMRASVYPEMATIVVGVVRDILQGTDVFAAAEPQDQERANYNEYIGDNRIDHLRNNWGEIAL